MVLTVAAHILKLGQYRLAWPLCKNDLQIYKHSIFFIWRISIVKMTIQSRAIYRFNAIQIKLPTAFYRELEFTNLQFVWKHKRPWIAKTILRKKNRTGGIRLPDFRLYHKATIIKAVWYRQKQIHRSLEYIESPEMNLSIYGELIYDKEGKTVQWKRHFFKKWC